MKLFFGGLKKYWVFAGRASRTEYWNYTLYWSAALITSVMVDGALGTFNAAIGLGLVSGLVVLTTFFPTLAMAARRLHDIGSTGWLALLGLVPGPGNLILFVLALRRGESGDKKYGPNPAADFLPNPRSRLYRVSKVLLITSVCIAIPVGGFAVWLEHNNVDFMAAGKAYRETGRNLGLNRDETECVSYALEQIAVGQDQSMGAGIKVALVLKGCFETSHAKLEFCEGIPVPDEILASATWIAAQCAEHKSGSIHCNSIFQEVGRYCVSPEDAQKLNPNSMSQSSIEQLQVSSHAMKYSLSQIHREVGWQALLHGG